ncbi:MAG: hypothetical protein AB8G23_12770 [Myxococcota bacterium]
MIERITSFGNRLRGGLLREDPRRTRSQPVLSPHPIRVQATEGSILEDPTDYSVWYCDGRPRYATCSGVSWFHQNYLVTVNVLGNAIHTYRYEADADRLTLLQTLRNTQSMIKPENVSVSPTGTLVAMTDMGAGNLKVFRLDKQSHRIADQPSAIIDAGDRTAHGLAFSHCGQFLASTTVDKPGAVRVYRVHKEDSPAPPSTDRSKTTDQSASPLRIEHLQDFENTLFPLVPKGIDFSRDGDFVVICYAPNVARKNTRDRRGRLATHAFDPKTGINPKPLSVSRRRHHIRCPDDVSLFGQDHFAVLTQQGDDSALVVEIDPSTGKISDYTELLRNPGAQLSFPHGVGVSPDGRFVAITSYGDDKFGIYPVRTGT